MLTRKMREFLIEMDSARANLESTGKPIKKSILRSVKYSMYMGRIQKRIDLELDQLYWLCRNHPQIFLDERDNKKSTYKFEYGRSYARLKKLLMCLKALTPNTEVQLILKEIEKDAKKQN